jgi:hypothetical protein
MKKLFWIFGIISLCGIAYGARTKVKSISKTPRGIVASTPGGSIPIGSWELLGEIDLTLNSVGTFSVVDTVGKHVPNNGGGLTAFGSTTALGAPIGRKVSRGDVLYIQHDMVWYELGNFTSNFANVVLRCGGVDHRLLVNGAASSGHPVSNTIPIPMGVVIAPGTGDCFLMCNNDTNGANAIWFQDSTPRARLFRIKG